MSTLPLLNVRCSRAGRRERTFERSVAQRQSGPKYIIYDGPPFATGLPHYGHILTSYIKDIIPRFFTMRGYHVPRRWGWDCHGLPIEFEVEKQHGFHSRNDILTFGVDRFNEECRAMVLTYASEWRQIITRLGRWVDFGNEYRTMDADYIESVIWVFKSLVDCGLVYEGRKVVAFCTRCQTPLSNFESRQDDALRMRTDLALSVRFRFADAPEESLVAWTTTPWTLPSNAALAVNPDLEYVKYSNDEEHIWIGRFAAERYARELTGYREIGAARGEQLCEPPVSSAVPRISLRNRAASKCSPPTSSRATEGTGVVHLAPAFGEDDAALCRLHGIEGANPVRDDGTFDDSVTDYAGRHVFDTNRDIARRLRQEGALLREEQYPHNYPHCWRCDTPLIYRAITTWFLRVTEIKARMLVANQRINWVPAHLRDGRFGHWLENARDWSISRSRFWGAPVPVWRCSDCTALEVVGSREELERVSAVEVSDWHRPAIDQVTWRCGCGGTMTRVADVLDCWFESGSMPYAQSHYPFERRKEFEDSFPGDFIVEYIAQTRGWFYTLVVLSAAIFDEAPFKNVICHGVILAEDGRKMSKRLKNYPDPLELIDRHGSDALRIALMQSLAVRGGDMRFAGEAATYDAVRRFCIPLWNCLHFFTAYAAIERFTPTGRLVNATRLDRYVLSETDRLRQTLEDCLGAYDVTGCYDAIEEYVVMLSTWYIRLSKARVWKSEPSDSQASAFEVLYAALSQLTLVMAPFLPFMSEQFHTALGGRTSVHLENWPVGRPEWRDRQLTTEIRAVRTIVRLARGIREAHRISHRQPLRVVSVANVSADIVEHDRQILLEELNVKDVRVLDDVQRYATKIVKLNYATLGKRFKERMPLLQKAIHEGRFVLLHDATTLLVEDHELGADDFSILYESREGQTGIAAEGDLVVALDLIIDDALKVERLSRDLNRGLQDLRKEAALNYDDRIVAAIVGPPVVIDAAAAHGDWLREQTLAVDIQFDPLEQPDARKRITIGAEYEADIMIRRIAGGAAPSSVVA